MMPADTIAAVVADRLKLPACRPTRVLGERAGRSRVIELTASAGLRVVAKATAVAEAHRAAMTMATLATVAPERLAPLAVPRLLLHVPQHGLVVQEHASGPALASLLAAPTAATVGTRASSRVGAALARLHAAPVSLGPPTTVADALADLVQPHPMRLAAALPELRPRVERVLYLLMQAPAGAAHTAPVHRDLHPRQVHLDGGRAWLLDWDLAAQGDPALDVGNLCGYLRVHLPQREAERAVASFLAGYVAAAGPAVLDRLPLFEAFTYLRLACKRFRIDGVAARTRIARLVGAAERCLDGERTHVAV